VAIRVGVEVAVPDQCTETSSELAGQPTNMTSIGNNDEQPTARQKSNTPRCIELYPRSFAKGYDEHIHTGGSRTLRVLQWNLLADGLCGRHPDKGGFTSSPPDCLEWKCRRAGIMAEVRGIFDVSMLYTSADLLNSSFGYLMVRLQLLACLPTYNSFTPYCITCVCLSRLKGTTNN
jgi:hypothetical protein